MNTYQIHVHICSNCIVSFHSPDFKIKTLIDFQKQCYTVPVMHYINKLMQLAPPCSVIIIDMRAENHYIGVCDNRKDNIYTTWIVNNYGAE